MRRDICHIPTARRGSATSSARRGVVYAALSRVILKLFTLSSPRRSRLLRDVASRELNCFWFGAAVRFFLLRPGWAMDRMTAPSEHRLYSTLVATLRGLGAMNSAPLLLSALALLGR